MRALESRLGRRFFGVQAPSDLARIALYLSLTVIPLRPS
jgi:hypothetical protein